jgi:hypothetical protein
MNQRLEDVIFFGIERLRVEMEQEIVMILCQIQII